LLVKIITEQTNWKLEYLMVLHWNMCITTCPSGEAYPQVQYALTDFARSTEVERKRLALIFKQVYLNGGALSATRPLEEFDFCGRDLHLKVSVSHPQTMRWFLPDKARAKVKMNLDILTTFVYVHFRCVRSMTGIIKIGLCWTSCRRM
jgi:hypothetical protein